MNFFRKPNEQEKMKVVSIPLYMIAPNPNQPRKYFDESAMEELKNSILEYGLLQPITVCKRNGEYELISGERRFRASQLAGLETIPAVIIDASESKSAILSLLENLQREDLSFFEIAESYKSLIREQGITQTELATKVGKSQSSVTNKLRLLRLPTIVRKLIRDYDLSEHHAMALLQLGDEQKQLDAAKIICRDNLSIAKTEELIKNMNTPPTKHIDKLRLTSEKNIKIFKNTVSGAVTMMKKSGIEANLEENICDWGTEYIIKIKKNTLPENQHELV